MWDYGRAEAHQQRKRRKLMARLVYDLGTPRPTTAVAPAIAANIAEYSHFAQGPTPRG
jgi:hypothetical protein